LWVLAAVVAAVLLIARVNIAHLLLARGAKREPEFRIRLSLGASRLRLVRQVLTESTVLGLVGGLAALPFALVFGRVVLRLATDDPAHATLRAMPDGPVLAFNFGVAMTTAVAFGLIPALRASRPDLAQRGRGLSMRALISVQVAISFVLLATAGLFVRSLDALRNVDPGFRTAGLLQAGLDPGGYKGDRISRFYSDVLGQVRSIPGVQSAALGRQPVIAGSGWSSGIKVEGYVPRQDDDANRDAVGAAYFSTLGIPLQMGREFTEADTARAPKVAIINEEFARRYFAGRNPLGLRIGPGGRSPEYTIVGVTRNARYKSLRETTTPFWHVPLEQIEDGYRPRAMTLFVRTAKHPEWLAGSIRRAVAQVDRNVALFDVRTLEAQVDENARRERLLATLSTFFGIVAALLAGTGLFGVLSWSVARRRREIGIRIAIGAGPFQAAWLVVRHGVGYVAAGVLAGLAATLALTSLVQTLLFGVPPNDVITLAGATLATLAIAVVATVLPARAAARVQPASTLRAD
jgi:predicted permease